MLKMLQYFSPRNIHPAVVICCNMELIFLHQRSVVVGDTMKVRFKMVFVSVILLFWLST